MTGSGWRPRLIATDLDGTLLGPDHAVSPTNLAAARRAAQLGIPFVVATGRPVRWLEVLDDLAVAHPQVIVSNGAAVFDLAKRRISRSFPIEAAQALRVAADLRTAIPGISFGFETATGFGCEPDCPSRGRDLSDSTIGRLPELTGSLGPVIKLLGYHSGLDSDELSVVARPVVRDRLTLTHSFVAGDYGMIELSAPGITKASTLALLCDELGIASADVAAFGDMPNDLPMLAWAGRAFVVASGHPSLLAGGYTVVPGNDADGVGRTVLALLEAALPPSPTGP